MYILFEGMFCGVERICAGETLPIPHAICCPQEILSDTPVSLGVPGTHSPCGLRLVQLMGGEILDYLDDMTEQKARFYVGCVVLVSVFLE